MRERITADCEELGVGVWIPAFDLCTDNAAMAGLAWEHIESGRFASLDCDVMPGLVRI